MRESLLNLKSGYPSLAFIICLKTISVFFLFNGQAPFGFLGLLLSLFSYRGLVTLEPNKAKVMTLFGDYKGTIRVPGLFFVNPFFSRRAISLKIHNFETGSRSIQQIPQEGVAISKKKQRTSGKPAKVNDRDGNPIEISAVVVWKIVNTFDAVFEVEDYEDFVVVQSEAALRKMASRHPYDSSDDSVSLRSNSPSLVDELRADIQDRLSKAGVEVVEARISHLAYAQEIASAMLQRQQATAIVAAREQIVEGAVGMVEMAIDKLSKDQTIELDSNEKAKLVSNLMVILCGDRHAQPVLNVGYRKQI